MNHTEFMAIVDAAMRCTKCGAEVDAPEIDSRGVLVSPQFCSPRCRALYATSHQGSSDGPTRETSARALEACEIVRSLANDPAPVALDASLSFPDSRYCLLCWGTSRTAHVEHEDDCPWRQAREWVAAGKDGAK